MKNTHQKILFFDFDGVIADSFELAYEIHTRRCPELTREQFRFFFEGNFNDWKKAKGIHTKACKHHVDFWKPYTARMNKEVRIFPGMKRVIKKLAKEYRLVIISSTRTQPIKNHLAHYHLENYFTEIMGNDIDKSKVKKIEIALKKYHIKSQDSLFITDTLGDLTEADQAGISAIGVTWGYHSEETLNRGVMHHTIHRPKELIPAVRAYFHA